MIAAVIGTAARIPASAMRMTIGQRLYASIWRSATMQPITSAQDRTPMMVK